VDGPGSTVIFTLLPQPGVSARRFNQDASTVQKDLDTLKALMERPRFYWNHLLFREMEGRTTPVPTT
jgi:hypothetical protein